MIMLSSLLGAIVLLPGCLSLISVIHAPEVVMVEQEFSIAVDGSVVGHGGGIAALVIQHPEELELTGAHYVGDQVRRALRKHAAIARRFTPEKGQVVTVLADSIPQTRISDASLRVLLRFRPTKTGTFALKFATGVVAEERGRLSWKMTDPAAFDDFSDLVDERYIRQIRVVVPERNGTAALSLSGKREYLLLPDSGLFRFALDKDFSVEFWCRTISFGAPLLSTRRDDYHGAHPFDLSVNHSGALELRCADGQRTYRAVSDRFIADGTWHHLAVSYCADSSRYQLFVDGLPTGFLWLPATMRGVTAEELLFGTTSARQQFASGEFEELRFWENCRNEQEIDYYRDLPLGGFESNLHALFSFDGGSDGLLPAQSQIEGLLAYAYNRPRLVVSTTPLRLELLAFSASMAEDEVVMTWETFDETKVLGYEVEKRLESGRYTVLHQIEPKRDPSRHQIYTVTDSWDGKMIAYYRLRKLNSDGSAIFSADVPIGAENILNFTLEDNSPNPFTDSTVIPYTVLRRTKVELAVFDMMGREIQQLVADRKEPGSYSVTFVAGDLPGGMYFYKMRTNAGSQTKKMYLAR
ncbi:MAG: T9SS type A sorting domain-containing protein [Bacteroidia bacterium]|nr:T9SS type A sorting domain-containing protein [Bacteroidia bacterium]